MIRVRSRGGEHVDAATIASEPERGRTMSAARPLSDPIGDLAIIDVDAHITEPHDLWSSRAPPAPENRI